MGLLTTVLVMHVFKAAQPALLYLVPACLGTPLLVAVTKGELVDLLKYVPTLQNYIILKKLIPIGCMY